MDVWKLHVWMMASLFVVVSVGCGPLDEDGPGNDQQSGEVVEHSGTLEDNATWSGTHRVLDNFKVRGTLTIEECADVQFTSGSLINVENGGAIRTEGSSDCPVTLTSAQSSPAAGDWQRIDIYSSASNNNSFQHTIVEYGGSKPQYGALWVESGARVSLSDVTIRDADGTAAYFENGADIQTFEGVELANIGDRALRIGPNEVGKLTALETSGEVPPIAVPGGTVSDEQTWSNPGLPYNLTGQVNVRAALEVAAGNELRVGPDVAHPVENGGTVRFLGESDAKITIRSNKSSPAAGDWRSFDFYNSAGSANLIRHAEIRHGGGNGYGAVWVDNSARLTLENTGFSDNQDCDVHDKGTVETTNTNYVSCLE
jgi:hypothetical protein